MVYISSIYKNGNKNEKYNGISITISLNSLYGRITKKRIEAKNGDIEEQFRFRG